MFGYKQIIKNTMRRKHIFKWGTYLLAVALFISSSNERILSHIEPPVLNMTKKQCWARSYYSPRRWRDYCRDMPQWIRDRVTELY